MSFVFQGNHITWPKYVGTIIGAKAKCGQILTPRNQWYSFTGAWCGNSQQWSGGYGAGYGWGSGYGSNIGTLILEDVGQVCMLNDITGTTGKNIRLYVEKTVDFGKKVIIYGTSIGNQPLMEINSAGEWQMGLTLTAKAGYFESSILVTEITNIVKEPMQGLSRLYEAFNGEITGYLAVFDPNEVNPTYRRSKIVNYINYTFWNVNGTCQNNSTTPIFNQVDVLVKLAFIPVVNPQDFLLVDNLDALKFAIQAVKADEANDLNTATGFWLKAIDELNFEDREKMPNNQTSIQVAATMSRPLYNPI